MEVRVVLKSRPRACPASLLPHPGVQHRQIQSRFMGRGKRPISAGEASQRLGGPSFICHILQPYLVLLSLTRASVIRAFLFLTQAKVIPLSGPCLGLCQECSYPPGSLVPFKSRLKCHFFVGASSSPSCVGLPWSFS